MNQLPAKVSSMRLGEFIHRNSGAIMEAWEAEARDQTPPAAGLARPALMDHLPNLLHDFAEVIRAYDERPSLTELANTHADEHAWERIEQGFMLEHVVRELALLRSCILRLWRSQFPTVSVDDAELLARVVERAIERSVSRYFERRSQLLTAMEQIADAAFQLRSDSSSFRRSSGRMQGALSSRPTRVERRSRSRSPGRSPGHFDRGARANEAVVA